MNFKQRVATVDKPKSPTDIQSETALDEAIGFLRRRDPTGPWHICTIVPDGKITCRTFSPEEEEALSRFLEERNGRENCYVHVNPLRSGKRNVKAKKDDVDCAAWLHVDIDDVEGLDRLRLFSLPPTAVVFSGGGYNAYWRLGEATSNLDAAERANRILVELLRGDPAATDVSRILRLPGTINLPTKKKIARGRKITLARMFDELTDWRRSYGISEILELSKSHGVTLSQEGPLGPVGMPSGIGPAEIPSDTSERIRHLIAFGDDHECPRTCARPRYPSRSEAVFAVACALAHLDCRPEDVAAILIDPKYRISESLLEKMNPYAEAFRQAKRAADIVANTWPDGVSHGSGIPRRGFQNTQVALLKLGISFWFDEFRQRMFVAGHAVQAFQGELNDRVCLHLRDLVNKEFRFDPTKDGTRDAVEQLCNQNSVDPVKEYLGSIIWDGKPRLDSWLSRYASADDTPYARAVGSIALIAAVRRVRSPGTKFDTILVLEGVQGSGKSTLIRTLASDAFFSDQDILALDHKSQMEAVEGVWLYELCELAGMKYGDVNKIKAFASRVADRARPAYGRFSESRPRRAVFIGTTNDDSYLKDETGNRRFWPVRTGEIDLADLHEDRDQLWAEAAAREALNESIVLPRELWPIAAEEQMKRVEFDGWEVILEHVGGDAFSGREVIGSADLLTNVLGIARGQITHFHFKRLSKAMKQLGWQGPVTVTMPSGQKQKGYWRATEHLKTEQDNMI